jgi:hypothetical protein
MNESEPRPVLHLPVLDIPIPTSVSKEAQAMMSLGPWDLPPTPNRRHLTISRSGDRW